MNDIHKTLIKGITNKIQRVFNIQSHKMLDRTEYAVAAVVLSLPKTLLLFCVAYLMGIYVEVAYTFIIYGILRSFSRGVHAKNSMVCFLAGMGNYLGIGYLCTILVLPHRFYNAVFLTCFIVYALYAPSGTKKRPVGKKEYKRLKILSLAFIVLAFILSFTVSEMLRNIFLLVLVSQAITIIPLTYKILKQEGGVIYEGSRQT